MRAMKYLSALALAASAVSAPAYAASSPSSTSAVSVKASAPVKKGNEAFHATPALIIAALVAIGVTILLVTDSSKSP